MFVRRVRVWWNMELLPVVGGSRTYGGRAMSSSFACGRLYLFPLASDTVGFPWAFPCALCPIGSGLFQYRHLIIAEMTEEGEGGDEDVGEEVENRMDCVYVI